MEKTILRPFPLMEQATRWLMRQASENRVPLLTALIVGSLAHMFAFTNKLVNHDEVYCLFSKGGTVTSGRWGLGLLDSLFPNYSMPWIYGVITLVLMAASICMIIHVFEIQSKLLQGLLAGSIIAFPSLTGTFGYMFTSSSYALSFFLAVLAVLLLKKGTLKFAIPALACMVFSLSIYQSYISISAGLLVLILIQRLLHEDDVVSVLKKGVWYLAFLLFSLAGYFAATQVILRLTGNSFNGYASGNLSFSLSSVVNGIFLAYSCFWRFFTDGYQGLIPTEFARAMHLICLAAVCVLLVVRVVSQGKKAYGRLLLLAALIGILPLAINCMYLITTADSIHTLVLYGFVSVYIFAVIIADACLGQFSPGKLSNVCRQLSVDLLTIALCLIIAANTYIANEAYLNLYLRYENAYSFYTSLIADLRMMPEFDENTKLAIIGSYESPEYFSERFEHTDLITGVHGFVPDSYSADRFLEYYLGLSIPFATQEETEVIQCTPEYHEMAVYPYYGSTRKFGDILVVKLS